MLKSRTYRFESESRLMDAVSWCLTHRIPLRGVYNAVYHMHGRREVPPAIVIDQRDADAFLGWVQGTGVAVTTIQGERV